MPGENVHENSNAQAPQPSAPDPSKMDHVSGYDNIGFNTAGTKRTHENEMCMNAAFIGINLLILICPVKSAQEF